MTRTSDDARFWDRFARRYAAAKIKDMEGYERTLASTLGHIRGMDSVLEIGCGTGTTALRIAPHVGRMLATDVSGEMIAIAQAKPEAQACASLAFAVASPETVPAERQSFDAVLAFNVLHLLGDRAAALARIHRLLKPGGLFISKTICLREMTPLLRVAVPVMRFVRLAPHHVAFQSAAELEAEITGAGFTVLERARHGSGKKDPRIFIVARRNDDAS